MGTQPTPAPQTLEDKILLAIEQADQIVAEFSPGVATLIGSGVAVEPVISGFARMIIGLFKHHVAPPAPAKQ
jgi:hypothetical protein